jgi:carnitine O-acetyltransferase
MIASTGRGCDRHLMVLRLLNLEHRVRDDSGKLVSAPLHPMFTDPIFAKSQTFRLITSGLEDGEKLVGNAFYVPIDRGYGVTYMSGPKVLKFGITSSNTKNTLPARYFGDALARALHDVFDLCKQFGLNESEQRDKSHL